MTIATAKEGEPSKSSVVKSQESEDERFSTHPSAAYYLLCFTIAILCYMNTLVAGMVWDDRAVILHNPDVLGQSILSEVFLNDYWGAPMRHINSHKSYRPVTILTFRVQYALFGSNPMSYHLVNSLLHGVASCLVVVLGSTFDSFSLEMSRRGRHAGLLAGLLFAVHAVHTEAVASIVGRADVLSTIFFLLSVLSHLQCVILSERYLRGPRSPRANSSTRAYAWLLSSFAAGALAMLSKEVGLTVLGVNVLVDLLLHWFPSALRRSAAQRRRHTATYWERTLRLRTKTRVSLTAIFAAAALGWRLQLHQGGPTRQWDLLDNPAAHAESWQGWLLTVLYSHARYLRFLVLPLGLCYDHSYGATPIVAALPDARVAGIVASYAALLAMCAFARRCLRSGGAGGEPDSLPATGVGVLVLGMLPASNLLFPIGTLLAERLLYLPSVGFCLLYGCWTSRAISSAQPAARGLLSDLGVLDLGQATRPRAARAAARGRAPSPPAAGNAQRALKAAVFIWIPLAVNAVLTVARNRDWRTEEALFESAFHTEPDSARVLNNYAAKLLAGTDKQELIHAKEVLQKAVHIYPQYATALGNLGQVHRILGDYFEAVDILRQSLKFEDNCLVRVYLGDSLTQLALDDRAPPQFHSEQDVVPARGIRTLPDGTQREDIMDFERAKSPDATTQGFYHLSYAIQAGCAYPVALFSLGVCYAEQDEHEKALKLYNKALELNVQGAEGVPPQTRLDRAKVLNMIGLSLNQLGQTKEAIEVFHEGIELSPNSIELLSNAASAYLKLSELVSPQQGAYHKQRSLELLERALDLDRENPLLRNNVGWAYEQMGEYQQALGYYEQALHLLPNHQKLQENVRKMKKVLELLQM